MRATCSCLVRDVLAQRLAHRYELLPRIGKAIVKTARVNAAFCEAIDHAETLTSADDNWNGDPPGGLLDLFKDSAEHG